MLLHQPAFHSEAVAVSDPVSLAERSPDQDTAIQTLVATDKTLFIPAHHSGHWFYLMRKAGDWSVRDSRPAADDGEMTPGQTSIMHAASTFLSEVAPDAVPTFQTTGQQADDYSCGSCVVNAHRALVKPDYAEQTHQQLLDEALAAELAETRAVVIAPDIAEQVIAATSSAQGNPEQVEAYKKHLKKLVSDVQASGFYSKTTHHRIAGTEEAMNAAEALKNGKGELIESDEDFARRLQDAELRKAGFGPR